MSTAKKRKPIETGCACTADQKLHMALMLVTYEARARKDAVLALAATPMRQALLDSLALTQRASETVAIAKSMAEQMGDTGAALTAAASLVAANVTVSRGR